MDWNEYRQNTKNSNSEFGKLNPGIVQGLQVMSESAQSLGHLDPKVRSLIALAVAVTTRCDGCISVHTQHASERGATRDEIAEALGIAISMNAGAALVYSAHVIEAFDAL